MESLSADLLLEVFLRLPCKEIVVSRSVCKTWHNLLSLPNFTQRYREKSLFSSVFLFKFHDVPDSTSSLLVEFGPGGGVIRTPLSPNIPHFHRVNPWLGTTETHNSCIIGSCDGLIYFCQATLNSTGHVEKNYSYNPILGDCALLAQHEWPYGVLHPLSVEYTIGHISSAGSVKLLKVAKDLRQSHILTVGIDRRWRSLHDHLEHDLFGVKGVSLSGSYHWIHGDTYPMRLKTFNFREEEIGPNWKLPEQLVQDKWQTKLATVNDHLSVIQNSQGFETVVWMMEQYGDEESWCKKMVIGNCNRLKLEATLANGNILFSNYNVNEITVFNSGEEETTKILLHDMQTPTTILFATQFSPKYYLQ